MRPRIPATAGAAQAARTPETAALILGTRVVSYRELMQLVQHLAAQLRSAGVRPQDHVALLCDQGLHTVVVILGVLEIWAVWVAISPDAPRECAPGWLRMIRVRVMVVRVLGVLSRVCT